MSFFFFFNDTATTEIYTLSLHDALPILTGIVFALSGYIVSLTDNIVYLYSICVLPQIERSEEHTSELQSPCNLVCRLLLEKKKTTPRSHPLRVEFARPSHDDAHLYCTQR